MNSPGNGTVFSVVVASAVGICGMGCSGPIAPLVIGESHGPVAVTENYSAEAVGTLSEAVAIESGWQAVMYSEPNRKGKERQLSTLSSYDNFKEIDWTGHAQDDINDEVKSMSYRVAPYWEFQLCKHAHFDTPYKVVSGEGAFEDLGSYRDISSVRGIHAIGSPIWGVAMFRDEHLGNDRCFVQWRNNKGNFKEVRFEGNRGDINDQITSLRYNIPDGWELHLFKHAEYRELLLVLKGSGEERHLRGHHDRISSLKWVQR